MHWATVIANKESALGKHGEKLVQIQAYRVTALQMRRLEGSARLIEPKDMRIGFFHKPTGDFREAVRPPPASGDARAWMNPYEECRGGNTQSRRCRCPLRPERPRRSP